MMRSCTLNKGMVAGLVTLALLVVLPLAASADNYVLTASKWGKAQNDAVAAAGGTVVWSHGGAGIGVATSDNPDFLSAVGAGNAFQSTALDMQVQWQEPLADPEVITPGDETFFNLQWNMQAIDAPAAWAAGCTGNGVRVAIIDGGIYSAHQDLDDNIDVACSVSFVAGQPFNNDTGTFWHGTHVAGIVAAEDNGLGVIGVAPEATIIGVKALHGGSGTFGAVIGGILYSADPAAFGKPECQKADIINMSLGALFQKSGGAGSLIGALNKAVNFAGSKGVLVLSSAGNNGLDMHAFPALTHVPSDSGSGLSVSATGPLGFALGATNFDRFASYSNYGNGHIDIAAPGGDFQLPGNAICFISPVTHFCWVFDLVLSNCRGGATSTTSQCFAAGTSMASPAAAGVAALIKGANPGISLGALKTKLQNTATDSGPNGHDPFYGHGFVNAYNACTQ